MFLFYNKFGGCDTYADIYQLLSIIDASNAIVDVIEYLHAISDHQTFTLTLRRKTKLGKMKR